MAGPKKQTTNTGAQRKHYCPTCIKDVETVTADHEAKAVMVFPGRRMYYDCKEGHRWVRKETILL